MASYGPKIAGLSVGSSAFPAKATGAHNFGRQYFRHAGASGDVRGIYADLDFTSTGSGEVLRLRGIANGTLCATGGTINAAHLTGRVAAGKTVSGALNALRTTLEVAGTTPTPGGTLAAQQWDSNIVTGATISAPSAFCRVTDSGATTLKHLFSLAAPSAKNSGEMFVARHADATASHSIRIVDAAGTEYFFLLTTDTPDD